MPSMPCPASITAHPVRWSPRSRTSGSRWSWCSTASTCTATSPQLLLEQAPGRVALVTDAMAAAGADDGDYRLGSLNVSVRNGLAHLSGTSTIAGSTLTQDAALRIALRDRHPGARRRGRAHGRARACDRSRRPARTPRAGVRCRHRRARRDPPRHRCVGRRRATLRGVPMYAGPESGRPPHHRHGREQRHRQGGDEASRRRRRRGRHGGADPGEGRGGARRDRGRGARTRGSRCGGSTWPIWPACGSSRPASSPTGVPCTPWSTTPA